VTQIVRRDAADISGLQRLADLPRLLRLIAARMGSTMVWASLATDAQIPHRTLDPYVAILQTLYLIEVLPAWSVNLTSREVKASSTVRGKDAAGLATLRDRLGDRFVAGFVVYTGERAAAVGERITALPMDALWTR